MSQIDVHRLISALNPDLHAGLEAAASLAARNAHASVEIAHWLRVLIDNPALSQQVAELGIDANDLQQELDDTISDMARQDGASLTLSQNLLTLAREAWLIASLQFGRKRIALSHLLLVLNSDSSLRMLARGMAPSLRALDATKLEALAQETAEDGVAITHKSEAAPSAAAGSNEFLKLYTHDLTADAQAGRIDPVIGRDSELRQLIDVLMRRRQNNPILVGEAGVGKTAVAEALALEIANGNVPEMLRNVRLLMLDLSLLQAGAGVKGEFERRLHGVVDAVKTSADPIILFIDEAHGLIGAGGQAGQGDAANILKPALARGELRTIAATTWSEYKRYFEKDAALTRRFQPVKVNEPDEETAIRMLRGIANVFRKHHGVRIRESALDAAVRLSARYIPSRQLPDKAISLIDTAAASVALARQTLPEALSALRNELHLTEVEIHWLEDEPESEEAQTRIAELSARKDELQAEIDELQNRHGLELDLVAQADSLEDALASLPLDSDGSKLPQDDVSDNVTPFPDRALSERKDRIAALEAVQGELDSVIGEYPLVPRVVDRDVIAGVVARWTGIPVGKLLSDQITAVNTLDERLKKRVIGQDAAIARVAAAMRVSRAGLSDPRRPPAVFLFAGMSGTGKTETALSLADILYGSSQYLTTINMSEFKEEHKVSMLLGSPPGYVGYGEGGVLTEAVRRRPYGVLLLDEIDKAHPGVQEIFYQVFDKGMLRDGEGRDVDFKNTTIIMTANTGSELLASLAADPDTMPEGEALEALLVPELQKQFKPAFLGRTTILPFMPLGAEALAGIVELQIARIRERVKASYGAAFSLSKSARDALVGRAKSSEMGARVIEAMIARDLMPVLSGFFLDALIDGRSVQGVEIDFDGKAFQVEESAIANESAETSAGSQEQDGANAAPSVGNAGRAVTPQGLK